MTSDLYLKYEDIGTPVSGLKVDDHKFITVMPFARLEKLISNPLSASMPALRAADSRMQEYFDLHSEIQRAFDGAKRTNAVDYCEYVMAISNGEAGDTPTIDLYSPTPLEVIDAPDGGKATLIWRHDAVVVPYDGETQLAARFLAAQRSADTKKMPVVITVTHGKSVDFARQCFHDRNFFQRRASVGVAMAMDTRDVMINTVREIEAKVPEAKGTIEWQARQMPKGNSHLIAAASFVRTSVVCFAQGIQGVQLDKADVPEGLSKDEFMERAVLWFGRVLTKVAPYMKDRENYVASAPAIWAALGAMGNRLLDPNIRDRQTLETIADAQAAKLNNVDWRKGDHWIGIAVKSTVKTKNGVEIKGYSFAGGAKDTGSIAFKALNDETDANWLRVRPMARAA
jgi:hypothetical protein